MLVNSDGEIAGRAQREFPQHFPRPGWVEHDPLEIWRAVLAVTGELGVKGVSAIGITNQRETTVLWRRKTLEPVANAIVWQCRRSTDICERLRSQGLEETVRRKTGLTIDPYFSATKLMWFFEENPDLLRESETGELAFGTVDTWLLAKLSAGAVHATEPSNASRTMLYNLKEHRWDESLSETFGIPREVLPEVIDNDKILGTTAGCAFHGEEIPIASVIGDQQSALFGQVCFDKSMSKNTYGTGSFMLTNSGTAAPECETLLSSVAWKMANEATFVLEGSVFVSGAAIQWLRDGLGIVREASETGPLAESVRDTAGVHFVPALAGLGAPHWDPAARGSITGLTRGTTRAHIARATVEAMAFQTKDVADAMASCGSSVSELRVDGGASVMDLLCQFQADILQTEVSRPQTFETTAMGAAYLAGLNTGVWKDLSEVASLWKLDRRFDPLMSSGEAEERVANWRHAVAVAIQASRPPRG